MTTNPAGAGRRLRLRHLEYFVAVAEHGSIAAAADTLFVAASGVSQTIADLEATIGVTVFERSRSGSRLTAAGQEFLEPARRALTAFAEATIQHGAGSVAESTLAVISTPSLVNEPTSTLLGLLTERMPGVRISLTEPVAAFVSDVVQPVLTGTADVAVTEHPEGGLRGVRVVRLPDQEMRVVCPPGSAAPTGGVFTVGDLLTTGLVVAPLFESSVVYRQLQAADHRIDHAIKVRTEHRDAFLTLALAGAGAVLLERDRAERAARLGCVVAPLEGLPSRKVSAVARADRTTPALEAFLELCAAGRSGVAEV